MIASSGQEAIPEKKLATIVALDGVKDVTGSVGMTVMTVSGEFAEVAQGNGGGVPADGQSSANGSGQGRVNMAPIDVSSFSVSGVDAGALDLAPQTRTGHVRALPHRG